MHIIESFTAVATILNRTRRVHFDGLNGLTLEGITQAEARVLISALERIDAGALASRERSSQAPEASVAPSQNNVTQSEAARQVSREAFERALTARAREAEQTPPSSSAEVRETASKPHFDAVDHSSADPSHTSESVENTEDLNGKPAENDDPDTFHARDAEEVNASITEDTTPSAAPRVVKRGQKLPPPRVHELPKRAPLPTLGDVYQGVGVRGIKDHSDGGRLLILDDGARVKLDADGNEVARMGSREITEAEHTDDIAPMAAPPPNEDAAVPDAVMKSTSVKEVITHFLNNGVKDRDSIIARCLTLKANGAVAFQGSRDEEAVRRRVNSTMIVMGLGA